MRGPILIRPGVLDAAKVAELQTQMTQLQTERDVAAQKAQAKDQEIAAHVKSLDQSNKALTKLTAEKAAFERQLAERDNGLVAKDQQLTAMKLERDNSVRALTERDGQIATLTAEVNTLKLGDGVRAALLSEKNQLTSKVSNLEKLLVDKDALIATHLKEIDRLRIPPSAGSAPVAPSVVPMSAAMSSISAQVAEAQNQLKTQNNFAINNVAITLKTKVDPDKGTFRFFDPRDAVLADALDVVSFGIETGAQGAATAPKETVPDLSGLTAGAATRLVSAVGLRLDVATGVAPKSSNAATGQAFRQAPAAGEKVDRGTVVLAVFQQ
jgi:hypothetical protein